MRCYKCNSNHMIINPRINKITCRQCGGHKAWGR